MRMTGEQETILKSTVYGQLLPIPREVLRQRNLKDGDFVRVRLRLMDGREYLLPCRRLYDNAISLVRIMQELGIKNGDTIEILDVIKCTFLDYGAIPFIIADGLKKLIENAKGMCISFTAERLIKNSEVIENENLVIHSNHYAYVNSLLDNMVKAGLIAYARQRAKRKTKYVICKNSELWDYVKNHEIGDIVDFIMEIIKVVENVR